ncbi:hypothetical protein AGMMS49545_16340 [Betaproteobacteria bacterium]|nr:hypothetical protein AGMMS49545_16340 [Betaproteobacteria bacterium]GHU46821.1 hypothetical protein AGMMS50289_21080 [Betaproteobacteria bacterium]
MARTTSCPSCGAPVVFRAAASILAVCEYCRTTLVNLSEGVENLGRMASLVEDQSPLCLGAEGRYRKAHFTVVGRIQLSYEQGFWNEWFLLFDNLRTAWLSEASGEYMLSFLANPSVFSGMTLPSFSRLKPGDMFSFDKSEWTVSNLERAECVAGEGELPFKTGSGYFAPVADLRADARMATLDYSEGEDKPPLLFIGEVVDFSSLKWRNLRAGIPIPTGSKTPGKALRCPHCGAPLDLKHEGILAVGCPQCGSVTDAETGRLISRLNEMRRIQPLLPLGKVGKLRNEKLEAIGFMQRFMVVEGVSYKWREYLLARVEQPGYRWLVEYDGHWSLADTLGNVPPDLNASYAKGSGVKLNYRGQTFKHFQRYNAIVEHVVGEFTWRVKTGEISLLNDYVAPPLLLSREATAREISWSIAEYLPHTEIQAAFGVKKLPAPEGVYANQPSPWKERTRTAWVAFGMFAVIALCLHLALSLLLRTETYAYINAYLRRNGEAVLSEPFTLTHKVSSLQVAAETRALTPLNNTWMELSLSLVNEQDGDVRYGDMEFSHYSGYSDGYWDENITRQKLVFRNVPQGTWRLMLEHTVDPVEDRQWRKIFEVPLSLVIQKNGASTNNLWALLAVLVIWPLFAFWRLTSFEIKRWAESDHPIVQTADDDDE